MKHTVLIVDDEPNAREYLNELVAQNEELVLAGICSTGNEAIEFCKTLQPDIIFLDIEMPGKSGLETARQLMHKNTRSVIVFTTAFDQYAVQAFEVEAIGYLLKPFSTTQFSKTVIRAIAIKETNEKAQFNERMNKLFERYEKVSPVVIAEFIILEKGLELRIPVGEISYIISESEYVTLFTNSRKYLKRLNIKVLAEQLPPSFLRVHRSIIINRSHVTEWGYLNNGTYSFRFRDDKILKSSRSYQAAIQEVLTK